MKVFQILLPHILAGVVCIFVVGNCLKHRLADRLFVLVGVLIVVGGIVWIATALLIAVCTPNQWIMAKSVESEWKVKKNTVTTAIILGFGYVKGKNGIEPGEVNQKLLNWVIENTRATNLLVQEGVLAANGTIDKDTGKKIDVGNRKLLRIHAHDENIYVNTLDTIFCAMEKMEKFGNEAILVAHPLQLQRALWDWEDINKKHKTDYVAVIPPIDNIPYPANSFHKHTRSEWRYKIAELIVSRPRDFFSSIPTKCKAPLHEEIESNPCDAQR